MFGNTAVRNSNFLSALVYRVFRNPTRREKAPAKQMFKFMSILLLAQIDTMLHTASHTLRSLRCDVCSSSTDIFFRVDNGAWACMRHK
jgi:hypothetical protein